MKRKKIILAYSGGLDTTLAIPYLKEKYHFDVIAVAIDLGEEKNLTELYDRAMKSGAEECHIVDAQQTFAEEYLACALRSNALYEQTYPLVSALSRPLIAKLLVERAEAEGAVAISHGCTAKGNDQVRFDISIHALNPHIEIIAPLREKPTSREEALAQLEKNNISIPLTNKSPYSIDKNLWGRSCECGILEDPWQEPPSDAYELTVSPQDAPDTPEEIIIQFQSGLPVALNGKALTLQEIIAELNIIAGRHGVGRIDHIENRVVGIKSREIYEAPAAITLIRAHQSLEALCLTRDLAQYKMIVEQKIASMIYEGLWFSPLFKALQAFIYESQKRLDGELRLKLYRGNAVVTGRKSAYSLYNAGLATYGKNDNFDHGAAEGFINILKLPLQQYAEIHGNWGREAR